MAEETQSEKSNKRSIKPLLMFVLTLAIGAAVTAYGIRSYPQVLGLSKGQSQAQAEADKLVAEVGKLISLPTDEKPTIATVSDVEKVKEQAFFRNAKNGDRVLIYTNAKKAILYSPADKKVVEVGAVNINQQPQTSPEPVSSDDEDSREVTPTATPATE